MSRKPHKRKRRGSGRRPPPAPAPEPEEMKPIVLESDIGTFVAHTDTPPYIKYLIFRPDHAETVAEFQARRRAGEQTDLGEEIRRTSRFAELNLALDEWGFLAELYLDRAVVQEDEVEQIVAAVCDLLEQIDIGPDGGDLTVRWIEEIVNYTFPP